MTNSLNERTAADPTPQRPDEQTRAATSFARMGDALRYAAGELRAGRCVTLWPVDASSYSMVAWDFEKQADDAHFAPTAPLELDLPAKRGASFWR